MYLEWVCYLHNQSCHVIYTDYRPVPLQHFIYPVGGDGLYEVVNIQVGIFIIVFALMITYSAVF